MASSHPNSRAAYLLLYKRDTSNNILFYTLDNYAGIRVNAREVVVNCADHLGSLKTQQQLDAEINARKLDIRAAYPGSIMTYLNAKIMDDHSTLLNTKFYFVSPENPSNTNFINLPGGNVNPGENPTNNVIREVHEELGIDVSGIIMRNQMNMTITSEGRAIFPVDYDALSSAEKSLFPIGNVPSNLRTICNVNNIETSEAYSTVWRYYNDLDRKARIKFYEGIHLVDPSAPSPFPPPSTRHPVTSSRHPHPRHGPYHRQPRPGGNQDIYYKKYLKYKAKYLKLKASMKI
jgi:8-oxo-dGTP pyrophosphatase MutT (NUDIX family)